MINLKIKYKGSCNGCKIQSGNYCYSACLRYDVRSGVVMSTYHLKRRYFKHGTYSELLFKGDHVCCVTERPNLNNKPSESCIPEGEYTMEPHNSPKFGYCYIIHCDQLGVGKSSGLRTHILIHKGNVPSDVQGCLVPGKDFGFVKGEWGVVNSTQAFNDLMTEFNGETHKLIVEKH